MTTHEQIEGECGHPRRVVSPGYQLIKEIAERYGVRYEPCRETVEATNAV